MLWYNKREAGAADGTGRDAQTTASVVLGRHPGTYQGGNGQSHLAGLNWNVFQSLVCKTYIRGAYHLSFVCEGCDPLTDHETPRLQERALLLRYHGRRSRDWRCSPSLSPRWDNH
jgi:hypothetical protein